MSAGDQSVPGIEPGTFRFVPLLALTVPHSRPTFNWAAPDRNHTEPQSSSDLITEP